MECASCFFRAIESSRDAFYCHDSSIGPVVMAEKCEAAHMGSDVNDRTDIVRSKIIDLVFVVEDRVGELRARRLNPKVSRPKAW